MLETKTFKVSANGTINLITNIPTKHSDEICIVFHRIKDDRILDIALYTSKEEYVALRVNVRDYIMNFIEITDNDVGTYLSNIVLNYQDYIYDTVEDYVNERLAALAQLN